MVRLLRHFTGTAVVAVLAAQALPAQSPAMPVAEQFKSLHFRSIGPATMSGRIADLAVYEANPAIYYVATAHGGLWKTTSNGTTFIPQHSDARVLDRSPCDSAPVREASAQRGPGFRPWL